MPVQRSHQKPSPQVVRPDELPQFVPDPQPVPAGPSQRGSDGRFVKGNRVSGVGGRVRSLAKRHLYELGLSWLENEPRMAAMRKRAISQLKAEQLWLARTTGAGVLDPLAAAELRNACAKECLGLLLLEVPKLAGELSAGISLGDKLLTAARGHRLCALEISSRGAAARASQGGGGRRVDFNSIDVGNELRDLMKQLGPKQPPVAVEVEAADEGSEPE